MTNFSAPSTSAARNQRAAKEAVAISPETGWSTGRRAVVGRGERRRVRSCVGRSIELWDVKHRHEPPSARDVARLANRLYRELEVGAPPRHAGGALP